MLRDFSTRSMSMNLYVRVCVLHCSVLFFLCVTSGTHPSTPFSAVKIAIEKLIVLTLFCLCLFSC